MRILRAAILLVLLPAGAIAETNALNPPLKLTVDNRYPLPGGSMTFTLTGPPNAAFVLFRSTTPEETILPAWGRWFLDIQDMTQVGQGTLSPGGTATAVVPVQNNPGLVDTLFYFQARAKLGTDKGLSGSLSSRVVAAAPSGPRRPETVAATPDGAKAYVANQADGTLQVLNPVKDKLVDEMPIAAPVPSVGLPLASAIDPEGRHLFVINPQLRTMTVLHTSNDSVAAQVPVAPASRDIAFAFNGSDRKVFVTNERDDSVQVFSEGDPGRFTLVDTLALQGRGPGPIVVLPSGLLMIGQRITHELEVVDPAVPGGATVARTSLRGVPWDIVISGGRLVVPTFAPAQSPARGDGDNVVATVDMANFQIITPNLFFNQGTDFVAAAAADPLLAVVATGSGVVLVIDTTTLALLERIDLVPGGPTSDPYNAVFVGGSGKLWVLNHLRETVRTINTSVGPPFILRPEIPLARSGQPRVPLVDLSPVENGEWFFNTVEYFNGNANNPNRVTCGTCHPHTFSTGLLHPNIPATGKSSQTLFDMGATGPWSWQALQPDLMAFEDFLFNVHGTVGGTLRPEAKQNLFDFMTMGTKAPVSPFLNADGSMSEAAERGKTVFEGKAQCSTCHTAPLYIPVPPKPLTIQDGVGVGIAPDNVASLRGIWSSAPYLWNASAPTLRDVIVNNPQDKHGTTSGLTPQEIDDLVEFLKTL